MSLLSEVFRLDAEPLTENETRRERSVVRNNALYISPSPRSRPMPSLPLSCSTTSISQSRLFSFLLLSLTFILAYSLPPFRNRGFGEFLLAAHLAYVIPSLPICSRLTKRIASWSFSRPLTLLAFAYFIVMDFPCICLRPASTTAPHF
jgi:hypothetical protein